MLVTSVVLDDKYSSCHVMAVKMASDKENVLQKDMQDCSEKYLCILRMETNVLS